MNLGPLRGVRPLLFFFFSLWLGGSPAGAGDARAGDLLEPDVSGEMQVLADVPYGNDARQRLDVYLPATVDERAPTILMVHGGAWEYGDKRGLGLGRHKVPRWVPRGIVFVSTNYRMIPEAGPIEQARDVGRAVSAVQALLEGRGLDPAKLVLMGHSAGAHLITLLTVSPALQKELGVTPWLGTIAIDSGAYDVVRIMQSWHPWLFDKAFGTDPAYWKAASPYHAVDALTSEQRNRLRASMLLICSSLRAMSCPATQRFAVKARETTLRVLVHEEPRTHMGLNRVLGKENDYTRAVESFLASLDPSFARASR